MRVFEWSHEERCELCPAALLCVTGYCAEFYQRPTFTLVLVTEGIEPDGAGAGGFLRRFHELCAPKECPGLRAKLKWMGKQLGDAEKRRKLETW